jgi:hypothetical protein
MWFGYQTGQYFHSFKINKIRDPLGSARKIRDVGLPTTLYYQIKITIRTIKGLSMQWILKVHDAPLCFHFVIVCHGYYI